MGHHEIERKDESMMPSIVVDPSIHDPLICFHALPLCWFPLTEGMAERHSSKPTEQLLEVPVFLHTK